MAWASAGCTNGEGNEENVLPEAPMASTTEDSATTEPDPSMTSGPAETETAVDTDGDDAFPATYRFDCVDIQGVGDADGTAFQAQVLENTWRADIMNFKLNILLEVESRETEAGQAQLGIRSGVGPDGSGLCAQQDTISELIPVDFTPSVTSWGPSTASGECSAETSGTQGNSYTMELGPDFVVYIYAEDDDTTTFNCTPDGGTPDAVPVRAVSAVVSTDANEQEIFGTLNGCLLATEAMGLCSCLGECSGDGPDDINSDGECMGCPVGGTPLATLLGGVNPSSNCTGIMGEDALDLRLGFRAARLPNVPSSCGG